MADKRQLLKKCTAIEERASSIFCLVVYTNIHLVKSRNFIDKKRYEADNRPAGRFEMRNGKRAPAVTDEKIENVNPAGKPGKISADASGRGAASCGRAPLSRLV